MRVWLQVNVSGATVDHYNWKILTWVNEATNGTLEFFDKVVDINTSPTNGHYEVQTSGSKNKIRYASGANGSYTSSDLVSAWVQVTAYTSDGKFDWGTFRLAMRGTDTTTKTFYTVADTYVDAGYPSSNFGSSGEIDTGRRGGDCYAFVKFDLSSIPWPSEVEEATLRILAGRNSVPCGYGAIADTRIFEYLTSWSENTLTYNSANLGSTSYITGKNDLTYDDCNAYEYKFPVTDTVHAWVHKDRGNYGFVISSINIEHGGPCYIYSREDGQGLASQLIVRYTE
jgi:hypothetical protein